MNITGSSVQDSHNESINGAAVEDGLQALWAVARKAGEELQRLRTENQELSEQLRAREGELVRMRKDLQQQQELLRKVQEQQQKAEAAVALNGDRQMLTARVKELLAKIDSYL
jgi:predicted  nucleic acid-binding Zn-ribbon protein